MNIIMHDLQSLWIPLFFNPILESTGEINGVAVMFYILLASLIVTFFLERPRT